MRWGEPRLVDGAMWMDIELRDGDRLLRVGRVAWACAAEGALYRPSINVESAGLGLPCWPDFRALADAQDFVERLMVMDLDELRRFHGTQWPDVVL